MIEEKFLEEHPFWEDGGLVWCEPDDHPFFQNIHLFAARGQLSGSRREPAARGQLREPGEGQPAALWDTPLSKVRRCLEPCGTRKNEERNDDQLSTCKKDVLYIFSNV